MKREGRSGTRSHGRWERGDLSLWIDWLIDWLRIVGGVGEGGGRRGDERGWMKEGGEQQEIIASWNQSRWNYCSLTLDSHTSAARSLALLLAHSLSCSITYSLALLLALEITENLTFHLPAILNQSAKLTSMIMAAVKGVQISGISTWRLTLKEGSV